MNVGGTRMFSEMAAKPDIVVCDEISTFLSVKTFDFFRKLEDIFQPCLCRQKQVV